MFVTSASNIDYLISDVRIKLGDFSEPYRYSDSLLRTCLLQGVRALQKRWDNLYLVLASGMVVSTEGTSVVILTPGGTQATITGYAINDVFRNPDNPSSRANPIAQEDETPIVLASVVALRQSLLSSSAHLFSNWTDGEFSFSNVSSANALTNLLTAATDELALYFARKLAGAIRDDFPGWLL